MNILAVGDIVGTIGVKELQKRLQKIKNDYNVDFAIVNGENAAEGMGITLKNFKDILSAGADCVTMGNHTWGKKEIFSFIDEPKLIRPANYPKTVCGKGYNIYKCKDKKIAVINALGRAEINIMLDNPFEIVKEIVEIVKKELPSCDKLKIIEPMDVYNFHNTLARVDLVLTDSGGIQEEAISLGKPVIVLRDNTERTESIQLGCAQLIGSNQQKLLETVDKLLKKCNYKRNCNWEQSPYGDGYASERIVDILLERIPKKLENKSI